jgi:hypothetical protein
MPDMRDLNSLLLKFQIEIGVDAAAAAKAAQTLADAGFVWGIFDQNNPMKLLPDETVQLYENFNTLSEAGAIRVGAILYGGVVHFFKQVAPAPIPREFDTGDYLGSDLGSAMVQFSQESTRYNK